MNALIIVAGLVGVGKSTIARKIAEQLNAIMLDSDVLRDREENIAFTKVGFQSSGDVRNKQEKVYNQIFSYAKLILGDKLTKEDKENILGTRFYEKPEFDDFKERFALFKKSIESGLNFDIKKGISKPVVLCATFSKKEMRERAKLIANELNIPFYFINVVCKDEEVLKQRLAKRRENNPEAAAFEMYEGMKKSYENIPEEEVDFIIDSTDKALDNKIKEVTSRLKGNVGRIGYPDNPVSETGEIFKDSFFVSKYSSLEKLKESGFNLIELHFQTFNEIKKKKEIKEYAEKARKLGFKLVMHVPFMQLKNGGFEFAFLVKVNALANSKEVNFNEFKKTVELCSDLGISKLTMHASSAMRLLTAEEFLLFVDRIKQLNEFAKSKKVVLCVETGGLTIEQLQMLIKNKLHITLDTAHLVLDLVEQKKSVEEANNMVLEFFKKYESEIPVLHLTQTGLGKDSHIDLEEKGIVSVNDDIFKVVKPTQKIIFEFKPVYDKTKLLSSLFSN